MITSSTEKKVFIKSKPRDTATKISEFRNNNGDKRLNKTKVGNCRTSIMAFYSDKLGGLNTGLTNYVENPYFEKLNKEGKPIKMVNVPSGFEDIKDKSEILLQTLLEIKHGRKRGFYSNDAAKKGDIGEPTFFQTFSFSLNDGSTMLDTVNPLDEIAYHVALANKLIANSEKELKQNLWAKSLFYISLENESDEIKYKKQQQEDKAIFRLQSEECDPVTQRKFCKILGLGVGSLTDAQAYNLLSDFIRGAKGYGENSSIIQFNKLFELLSTQKGREEFEAESFLVDLVTEWIITERQGTYTWVNKKMVIGERKAEAIAFLLNPNKQEEQEEMKKLLKIKRNL